jgi:hypothetical protein
MQTGAITSDAPSASSDVSKGNEVSLPPKSLLLGQTYGEALEGKPFNPAVSLASEGYFSDTLSGPQTPSVSVRIKGKELLVWENCQAQNCPWSRSIMAVEVDGPGRFVATIGQRRAIVTHRAQHHANARAARHRAHDPADRYGAIHPPLAFMARAEIEHFDRAAIQIGRAHV